MGSLGARGRRRQLIADYVQRMGGNVGPIAMSDITRVVDLRLAASHQRAELAAGRAKLADVVKLEGTLARAMMRLNLPAANAAAPGPSLAEYLAQRVADEPEAGDT